MCFGGCEIIHIGYPVHMGGRSRVCVVMNRGKRADGSRKERVAGKPEGLSSEPVSNNFISSMTVTLTLVRRGTRGIVSKGIGRSNARR